MTTCCLSCSPGSGNSAPRPDAAVPSPRPGTRRTVTRNDTGHIGVPEHPNTAPTAPIDRSRSRFTRYSRIRVRKSSRGYWTVQLSVCTRQQRCWLLPASRPQRPASHTSNAKLAMAGWTIKNPRLGPRLRRPAHDVAKRRMAGCGTSLQRREATLRACAFQHATDRLPRRAMTLVRGGRRGGAQQGERRTAVSHPYENARRTD